MEKLFLYNTLTRKKEEFIPIKAGEVGLYTCGPTVYNYAHIGNLRAYIFADILARVLIYNYGINKVKWVMNITDVDDKTIRDSKIKYPDDEPMHALNKFTTEYEKIFWEDLKKINIATPNVTPHAANEKYILEMQKLVVDIHKKGYAYIKDGSVYFNVNEYAKKHKYGQLVNLDLSNLKTGTRIDLDEYDKENVQDFVLWKGKKEGEPFWDFEMAGEKLPGRPGWHIECSAMGGLELGMPFDIHTGGEDLRFPHHEDEIAQNTIAFDLKKPINFWVHNGMLMVEGKKMSKSLGNFYNLRDIENKGFNPLAFRYLSLMTHYRKPLDFSWESLQAAENGLNSLYKEVGKYIDINRGIEKYKWNNLAEQLKEDLKKERNLHRNQFILAINNDLNMPEAVAVLWDLLKGFGGPGTPVVIISLVIEFDEVLGLRIFDNIKKIKEMEQVSLRSSEYQENIKKLVNKRKKAREEKNFEESDRLRKEIEDMGYTVEDTKEGMRVFKK